jgi:hypothetical protein
MHIARHCCPSPLNSLLLFYSHAISYPFNSFLVLLLCTTSDGLCVVINRFPGIILEGLRALLRSCSSVCDFISVSLVMICVAEAVFIPTHQLALAAATGGLSSSPRRLPWCVFGITAATVVLKSARRTGLLADRLMGRQTCQDLYSIYINSPEIVTSQAKLGVVRHTTEKLWSMAKPDPSESSPS